MYVEIQEFFVILIPWVSEHNFNTKRDVIQTVKTQYFIVHSKSPENRNVCSSSSLK